MERALMSFGKLMANPVRSKLVILGIGDDGLAGLTDSARRVLATSDLILGAASIVSLLADLPARKVVLDPDMTEALRQVREALKREIPFWPVAAILFFTAWRATCATGSGKNSFEVLPHVSSMQLAFARVKESWEDAYLTNLAGRPIEAVIDRIRTAEKVGLFTSESSRRRGCARAPGRGIDYFRAFVCENLGSPDERVTQGELAEMAGMDFNPLNVLILVRKPNRPDRASRASRHRRFGNPDDAFSQSLPKSGLITQAEVRAIALAQLDIRASSVVWDIGAGSGSVAIEAAQLASRERSTPSSRSRPTSPDSGQRRDVRRPQREDGSRPGSRGAGGLARSRRDVRGWNRQTGRPGPERRLSTALRRVEAWR